MRLIQLAVLVFIVCRIFLFSLTLCNTSSFPYTIGPPDLLQPSPATHFKTFQVFLLYFQNCPSVSTIHCYAIYIYIYIRIYDKCTFMFVCSVTLHKKWRKVGIGKEEEYVNSYWVMLRKRESTGIWKAKGYISLCENSLWRAYRSVARDHVIN